MDVQLPGRFYCPTMVPALERRMAKRVAHMPWEDRPGGRYYYRAKKIKGRVVKEYVGAGPKADAAAAEDAHAREVREAQRRATHEQLSALKQEWANPLEEFNSFSTLCEALVAAALLAEGFHQHDRGAWRKRRMPSINQTAFVPRTIQAVPRRPDLTPENVSEVMADLLRRSRAGDTAASETLGSLTQNAPDLWDLLIGLARQARASWIALIAVPSEDHILDREGLERRLAQLQSELAAEGDGPVEALLIERILIAWIAANHSDIQLVHAIRGSGTTREIEYLECQQERTQRNLLRSMQSLATLRRLRPPAIQANVDERQMSVAG
jgi:hypothetical protein